MLGITDHEVMKLSTYILIVALLACGGVTSLAPSEQPNSIQPDVEQAAGASSLESKAVDMEPAEKQYSEPAEDPKVCSPEMRIGQTNARSIIRF
jgi:hypothetical protein